MYEQERPVQNHPGEPVASVAAAVVVFPARVRAGFHLDPAR